jgi:hypothetical protein
MLGVCDWGCPLKQPTQSLRSSTAISSTLGFSAAAEEKSMVAETIIAQSNIVMTFFKCIYFRFFRRTSRSLGGVSFR